jgi:general secretion pathway protein F
MDQVRSLKQAQGFVYTQAPGPLLMLFIGCSIGLIIVLMYLPIFQLAEVIG